MFRVDTDTNRVEDKKKATASTSSSASLRCSGRMSIDDDFMDNDDVIPSSSTSFPTSSSSSSLRGDTRNVIRNESRKRDNGNLNRYQNRNSADNKSFAFSSDDDNNSEIECKNKERKYDIRNKKIKIEVQPVREKMKIRFFDDQLKSFCSLCQCFILLKTENIKLTTITDLLKKRELVIKNQGSRSSATFFESGKKRK